MVFVADLLIIGLSATISTVSPSMAETTNEKSRSVVKSPETITLLMITLLYPIKSTLTEYVPAGTASM